jgi:hypothetical protein
MVMGQLSDYNQHEIFSSHPHDSSAPGFLFLPLILNFGTRFPKFSTNLNYKNFGKHVPKFLYRVKSEYWGVKKSHGGEENLSTNTHTTTSDLIIKCSKTLTILAL